jgi:hypothetical protein
MASRLGLRELAGAGFRVLSKYTGTVLSVFVVQSLVSLAAMFAIAVMLAQQFAHLPMFDDAVDGDLVSLIWCLRTARDSLLAIGGLAFGTIVMWQLVSWFLVGGLCGVFAQRPEGRSDTARCFGASGTATYLAYARLAVCSMPGWIVVLFAFGLGTSMVFEQLETALTIPQLVGPIALAVLPSVLLLHYFWTVTDYARIELSLRRDTHDPGVIVTYLRTLVWVARRPLTLVHSGLGWMVFVSVTIAYWYLAQGHPMYGTEGAITLFFVRQGVALFRIAIAIGVLGGQIELGRGRPLPPRRAELDDHG